MNAKNLVTAGLLTLVAVAVVTAVVRETGNRRDSAITSDAAAVGAQAPLPDDGIVVTYFHGNVRCPTCRNIEAYAHSAVTEHFANELADGRVVWRVVNYEAPGSTHYVDEFQIVAPIVVLTQHRDGQQAEWRSLDRVWELVGDEPAFAEYVRQEVGDMMASENGTNTRADVQVSLEPVQGGR